MYKWLCDNACRCATACFLASHGACSQPMLSQSRCTHTVNEASPAIAQRTRHALSRMRRLGLTGSARCMIKKTVRKLVDKTDRHSVSKQRRSLARSKCCSVCDCCRTHLAQLALRGCLNTATQKLPRNHKQQCRVARRCSAVRSDLTGEFR